MANRRATSTDLRAKVKGKPFVSGLLPWTAWPRRRWFAKCLLLILISSFLPGCWNSRELNDLAIVSAIGIDKSSEGGAYQVTFQVVNPSATATNAGASTGQPPITIYTSTDQTLFGALRKTSKKASRQLFFAHTQLIIVGENVAKDGIHQLFDIFERSHELRLNSLVLISRGTAAASILKVLLPIENLPSLGMVKKTRNTAAVWGENSETSIYDLIHAATGVSELTISGVKLSGNVEDGKKNNNLEQTDPKTAVVMSGLAVFKKGKQIDWLDGNEAKGALRAQDRLMQTNQNIQLDGDQGAIAINIVYSKTKIKVEVRQGKPVFHLHIEEEGIINETKSATDISSRTAITALEKEMGRNCEQEVMAALQYAQGKQTDIFGFGDELKRTRPEVWTSLEANWDSLFAQAELDVQVESYIRSTGMRLKPYLSDSE